ncbi:MAG: DUF839 domain-containing protein [Bdellovibrionales bacterium]|nr:DUF839 domain-containing protein [Bdellovibrionales bacterium]
MSNYSRREFLAFLGYTTTTLGAVSLVGCKKSVSTGLHKLKGLPAGISKDEVTLAEGFSYDVLIKYGDDINDHEKFGFNNDYIAILPKAHNRAVMWVNHEYPNPLFIHGNMDAKTKTKEQIDLEMKALGGSIVHLEKDKRGHWSIDTNHPDNYRVHAQTMIPLISERSIEGKMEVMGTHSNCAGGITPWGTVLTCEENYHDLYGERKKYNSKEIEYSKYDGGWTRFYNNPPEYYGWVVEIDTDKKTAKKLTALGRFAHEGATCINAKDGRTVVYLGDDKEDECIYKFISAQKGSLEKGTLYVADTENGKWIALDHTKNKELQKKFKNQTEVLTWARLSSKMVGATPQNRPEDIEINPANGDILVSLTNNKGKKDYHGSILRIREKGGDYLSTEFEAKTLITGGPETGFAAPDNLAFDNNGNLWIATDISGSSMNKDPYTFQGNNGLFVVPMMGENAGKAIQVASAPHDAEFTGPFFAPDGKTLFLSVQHPGENTKSIDKPTSHWPLGGKNTPQPAVIAITGPMLEAIAS